MHPDAREYVQRERSVELPPHLIVLANCPGFDNSLNASNTPTSQNMQPGHANALHLQNRWHVQVGWEAQSSNYMVDRG